MKVDLGIISMRSSADYARYSTMIRRALPGIWLEYGYKRVLNLDLYTLNYHPPQTSPYRNMGLMRVFVYTIPTDTIPVRIPPIFTACLQLLEKISEVQPQSLYRTHLRKIGNSMCATSNSLCFIRDGRVYRRRPKESCVNNDS